MTKAARSIARRLATKSAVSQALIITAALLAMASIGLGSAFAARGLISSRDIKNHSIRNADLGTNSVNGRTIQGKAVGLSKLTPDVQRRLNNVSKGAKGDTGAPGATGPAGPKGDAGAKGDKGDAGATGPAGGKGDAGAKGDQGDTGPAGPPGYPTLVTPSNGQFKDNTTTGSSDTPWAVTDLDCNDPSANASGLTKGFQNGQPGGQDAPLETGAYGFDMSNGDSSIVLLGLRKYDGQKLSTLSELRYSERFHNPGPSTTDVPLVEILVDNNDNGSSSDPGDDQLLFEPAENTDEGAIAQDGRWQSWNVVDGKVRFGANPAQTFKSYVAGHPDARIQGTQYAGGIRLRAEDCGQTAGYNGAFDNVTVNGPGGRVIYDFEAS